MLGVIIVENFIYSDRGSWPFAASIVFFVAAIVRRHTEKVVNILFNSFAPQAQEALGRWNLYPQDLLSIPTDWAIAQVKSHFGLYLGLVDLWLASSFDPWALYIRSGTSHPDNGGSWARLVDYFGFNVKHKQHKNSVHLDHALLEGAIQYT